MILFTEMYGPNDDGSNDDSPNDDSPNDDITPTNMINMMCSAYFVFVAMCIFLNTKIHSNLKIKTV